MALLCFVRKEKATTASQSKTKLTTALSVAAFTWGSLTTSCCKRQSLHLRSTAVVVVGTVTVQQSCFWMYTERGHDDGRNLPPETETKAALQLVRRWCVVRRSIAGAFRCRRVAKEKGRSSASSTFTSPTFPSILLLLLLPLLLVAPRHIQRSVDEWRKIKSSTTIFLHLF